MVDLNRPRPDESELRALARRHGQEHVFRYWEDLGPGERAGLLDQLGSIDFELVDRLVKEHLGRSAAPAVRSPAPAGGALSPAPVVRLPGTEDERQREAEARRKGEELLRAGKVAAFVVAGGQGTRLGFDGPKGAFPIGPVSRRTLFQLHAEKIRALSRRCGRAIPWYIMTSASNHLATTDFFRGAEFFRLAEEDVRFFQQDTLPAVDRGGKIILETRSRIFTSPNGHGGSIKALNDSGALDDMRRRGIDAIFYFQVDNPLLVMCDPVFLGRHALAGAEMSSKAVRKAGWSEKVGVIGRRDGRLTVIEYSDMPEEQARETLPDGSLKYWAGSIAIHALSVDFVGRLNRGGFQLPYHVAEKAIPFLDERGEPQKPAGKNGIKFETFVFDALQEARESVTMEVRREDEFSPVKNASGEDSVEKSRRDMTAMYLRWLEACGARIERGRNGGFEGHVEISPLTSLDGTGLAERVGTGKMVRDGFRI